MGTGLNQYGLQRCQECGLCKGATMKVDGRGPLPCDVYFLGEGPGREEDKKGVPFVGRAGQFLDECIKDSGLGSGVDSLRIRIGNTVRCRPPNNRKPTPGEIETCSAWTELELSLAQPKVIVALGATAISYFFPNRELPKKSKVGDYIGKPFTTHVDNGREILVYGSYHPAARKASQRNQIRGVCKMVAEMFGIEQRKEEKVDYRLEILW